MRVSVRVKLRAKEERVEETGAGEYTVFVHAKPIDGQANEAVIRLLAGHVGIAPTCITIVSGHAARRKVLDLG